MCKLLSVFIPVYNTEHNDLKEAIECILNQSYKDFELVIINDGSNNGVEDIILSYKDKRIKYCKNEKNTGIINVSNQILDLCTSKYLAKLDSDDYCTLDRLEKQLEFLESHSEIGVVGTYFEFVPGNKKVMLPVEPYDVKLCHRYVHCCINNSSVMARRAPIVENNIRYNESCKNAEDYKFWSELSRHTELAVIPEFMTYYRLSPNGITARNLIAQRKMAALITLDNIIKDFAADKKYFYSILVKFVKGEAITDKEFNDVQELLVSVHDFLYSRITPPFNEEIRYYLMSFLNDFVRL